MRTTTSVTYKFQDACASDTFTRQCRQWGVTGTLEGLFVTVEQRHSAATMLDKMAAKKDGWRV